jgi:small redox-active disulfide protein 2
MKTLQILGAGCAKCEKLAETAEAAAKNLGIDYELVKIKDVDKIAEFGVMMPPALAVDGEVKVTGKVPSIEKIEEMLK